MTSLQKFHNISDAVLAAALAVNEDTKITQLDENTASQIKKHLQDGGVHPDTVGKARDGTITVRKGFFYSHGKSSADLHSRVKEALSKHGVSDDTHHITHGEHYTSFRGGASVADQTHWWVKIKPKAAATTESVAENYGYSSAEAMAKAHLKRRGIVECDACEGQGLISSFAVNKFGYGALSKKHCTKCKGLGQIKLKEEIEQVNESIKIHTTDHNGNTYKVFINKADKWVGMAGHKNIPHSLSTVMFHKSGGYDARSKELRDVLLQAKDEKHAVELANKHTGYQTWKVGHPMKEEVEQIDELSKQKLGDYVKAAMFDYGDARIATTQNATAVKGYATAKKRRRGIYAAVKKLTENAQPAKRGRPAKGSGTGEAEPDQNIIVHLKKAVDTNGEHGVAFMNKQVHKVPAKVAEKVLKNIVKLKPDARLAVQAHIAASHENLMQVHNHLK